MENESIKCSYCGEDISNFFIDNNIKYTKEPLYTELLGYRDCHKFDWKIQYNKKIYYI